MQGDDIPAPLAADTALLRSTEAAKLVGGYDRLKMLVRTGALKYYQLGFGTNMGSMRFDRNDIEQFLQNIENLNLPTVYVVGFGEYVKIGFTTYLPRRILELEQFLPEKLTLIASFPGDVALERLLHARFKAYRRHGEWFLRLGKLRLWIDEDCPL